MMKTYGQFDIEEVPLGTPFFRRRVESFLEANGLRMDPLDLFLSVCDSEGQMVAGAGLSGDVIKCVAVSPSVREEGLSATLVSELIGRAASLGRNNLKVFTKPANRGIFSSLGFREIASSPEAVLMENGQGLEEYISYLRGFRRGGRSGAVVMNANPLTEGHVHLLRKAASEVDTLFVIPVREDRSLFPYEERKAMISAVLPERAVLVEGSSYVISAATFPAYFLKDPGEAASAQIRLDLDLFVRQIAPALGVSVRFVGSEPADPLTARYNRTMSSVLPDRGIEVREIPRLSDGEGPVSATRVRDALEKGHFGAAAPLTPPSTLKYLVAALMERSLRMELDTPGKPGLVGPGSRGGHMDMDYDLMLESIRQIRTSFLRHFDPFDPIGTGKAVEAEVLARTGGINTHRGAIFSQILVASAFLRLLDRAEPTDMQSTLQAEITELAGRVEPSLHSHGGSLVSRFGVKGALPMARYGYRPLFDRWLPYFRSSAGDPYRNLKTLLLIMSSLDDTCILHRVGFERARTVKEEASALLDHFTIDRLKELDRRYSEERISPGGSADMLSLTMLVDSLLS